MRRDQGMSANRIGCCMLCAMVSLGGARAADTLHNTMILNRYQVQELEREQARYGQEVGPQSPAQHREMERRLQGQRLEQRALQERGRRGASALERSSPLGVGGGMRSAQELQRLRRDQRQQRLELNIQRRAWPYGR
jgi:hypothetical protein